MLSSVLGSERAVQMNIVIVRAFIKLREIVATHEELAKKLAHLERKYEEHDNELTAVFEAIRNLISAPEPPKRRIGFNGG